MKFYAFVLLIFFLFYFLLTPRIIAAPQIEVSLFPSSTIAGEEFTVTFLASSLDIGAVYYAKALGGEGFYDVQTWSSKTSNWLSWNSLWSDMPEFTATESTVSGSIKARFKNTTSAGLKEFKVRIRRATGTTNYDSDSVGISVSNPTPTPTPDATPTPSSTPESTSIATATPTSKPTPKVAATKKPSASRLASNVGKDEDGESAVLGLREGLKAPSPSPLPGQEGKKKIPIAAGLFVLGGLGFMGASAYPFLKEVKKRYNVQNEKEGLKKASRREENSKEGP